MSRLTQKCIASPVQQRIQAKYIDRTIFKESKTDAARQVNFKMTAMRKCNLDYFQNGFKRIG